MSKLLFIVTISASILLTHCVSKQVYVNKPIKSNINPENDLLEMNTLVYHENDTLSKVYIQINNESLLYKYADTSQFPYAEVRISYRMANLKSEKIYLDTGSILITDRAEGEKARLKSIYAVFNLKARLGEAYVTEIEAIDLNKRIVYNSSIEVLKLNHLNPQNFLIYEDNQISFKTSFGKGNKINIKTEQIQFDGVYVDCFLEETPLALPPFSTKEKRMFKFEPDSTYFVLLSSGNGELQFNRKGFYYLRFDNLRPDGLSLFCFDRAFPRVNNTNEMINCTRYIMTKEEFRSCIDAGDQKAAIDKFWLQIGGSSERAKDLLRKYYNRVFEANKYYTGFGEGWKSDRGMIYIVFGQPTSTVQNEDEEVWIYGSATNQTTNTFIFRKVENAYSKNVYVLDRSQFYKPAWSNAVDQWRQGVYFEGKR